MLAIPMHDWTAFKALAISKQLGLHYSESSGSYIVYMNEGVLLWSIVLVKDGSEDVVNFETHFKALSNRPTFFLGQFRNKFLNITGNTTSVIKTGAGVLRSITINNNNTGGSVTIYDSTQASGTKIASFQLGTPLGGLLSLDGIQGPSSIPLVAEFSTGLTVVTAGSGSNDITVYYT